MIRKLESEEAGKLCGECIEQLLSFVTEQVPSQRLPISIVFLSSSEKVYNKFLQDLFAQTRDLMQRNSECFINQYSLYKETETIEQNRSFFIEESPAREGCLSRITGRGAQEVEKSGKKSIFPYRSLRTGIKKAIARLKKENLISDNSKLYTCNTNDLVTIEDEAKIQEPYFLCRKAPLRSFP